MQDAATCSDDEFNNSPVVAAAEASSLDEVAWGLLYPDTLFRIEPFRCKGWLLTGRGNALEEVWRKQLSTRFNGKGEITLAQWRRELSGSRSIRPALIFNSTLVETGEQFLLGSTDLNKDSGVPGMRLWNFDRADIEVATAARLSASFTYISPAARELRRGDPREGSFHAVDGGYYDNYGMSTLIEWLEEALEKTPEKQLPSRVLIIEIRSAAPSRDEEKMLEDNNSGGGGFLLQAAAPIQTELNVRDAAQVARNDAHRDLLMDRWQTRVPIRHVVIAFEDRDEHNRPALEALNWHLTPDNVAHLRNAWHKKTNEVEFVMACLKQGCPNP